MNQKQEINKDLQSFVQCLSIESWLGIDSRTWEVEIH